MKDKIKLISLTLLIYGLPIAILSILPFSKGFFGHFESFIFNFLIHKKVLFSTFGIIFDFLLLYCIFLLLKKEILIEKERVYLIYTGLKKIFNFIFIHKLEKDLIISQEEKVSLLFYLVKIVFLPVMIRFTIGNVSSLIYLLSNTNTNSFKLTKFNILGFYFHFVFYLIFITDTVIFSLGYLLESPTLRNVVKSVEPTALGWIVALVCYPPFNSLTSDVFGWYTLDFNDFGNIDINIIASALSILLLGIYVWASIALGFKASNLTNRGIVSHGPYKYIRHPAYISKNLSWWIMAIPFIKTYGFVVILSLTIYSFIYFLRALTEERHLMKDENYVKYIKKVKYMFIPGVF